MCRPWASWSGEAVCAAAVVGPARVPQVSSVFRCVCVCVCVCAVVHVVSALFDGVLCVCVCVCVCVCLLCVCVWCGVWVWCVCGCVSGCVCAVCVCVRHVRVWAVCVRARAFTSWGGAWSSYWS